MKASALAHTAADKQKKLMVKYCSFFSLLFGSKRYVEAHSCVPSGYFDGGKGAAAAVGAEQRRMVSMMATLAADSLAEKSSARPCKTFMRGLNTP